VIIQRPIFPSESQEGKSKNFSDYFLYSSRYPRYSYSSCCCFTGHHPESRGQRVKLTIHLHLQLRLRASRVIPLFPPHACNLTYLEGIYIKLSVCNRNILYKISKYNNGLPSGMTNFIDISHKVQSFKGQERTYREHGDPTHGTLIWYIYSFACKWKVDYMNAVGKKKCASCTKRLNALLLIILRYKCD